VDVPTEDGDKFVLIPAGNSSDASDSSRQVGSKESQRKGVNERRDARAREG
jgi:hypothetical protein